MQNANKKQKTNSKPKREKTEPKTIGDLLGKYKVEDRGGYISREFQDFGYRVAMELNDEKHKALYFKMAKSQPRARLERALSFVKDAGARSPARLFMWKVKQLRLEDEEKEKGLDS